VKQRPLVDDLVGPVLQLGTARVLRRCSQSALDARRAVSRLALGPATYLVVNRGEELESRPQKIKRLGAKWCPVPFFRSPTGAYKANAEVAAGLPRQSERPTVPLAGGGQQNLHRGKGPYFHRAADGARPGGLPRGWDPRRGRARTRGGYTAVPSRVSSAHAGGRRWSESRVRENRTHGSMRGRWCSAHAWAR